MPCWACLLLKLRSKTCPLHREFLDLQTPTMHCSQQGCCCWGRGQWCLDGSTTQLLQAQTGLKVALSTLSLDPLASHFHPRLSALLCSWLHTTIHHLGRAKLKKPAWTNCNLLAMLSTFLRPHGPQDLCFDHAWIYSLQVTVELALKWLRSTRLHESSVEGRQLWAVSTLLWVTQSVFLHYFIRGLKLQ